MPDISISIVSHQQAQLVRELLEDIQYRCTDTSLEVILTLNVSETMPFNQADFDYPVHVITNEQAKGFGENHNDAFRQAQGSFFCVLNPDIRLQTNPFPELLKCLSAADAGVVAPRIINQQGQQEDSARDFPAPFEIIRKFFGGQSSTHREENRALSEPDWLAGMFLIFPCNVFELIGGFDEGYFLYYEDVDLCARLNLAGFRVLQCQQAAAIHEARRSSHRNLRYLHWHLSSMLRFFSSDVYREIRQKVRS